MTSEEFQAIRERVSKATEGPWKVAFDRDGYADFIAQFDNGEWRTEIVRFYEITERQDAILMAHAREDVPKLLDMVERLRKALVFIRERVNELTDDVCEEFFLYEIDDAARQALSEAGR